MSDGSMQRKILLGILVGAGVGFATALLLAPQHRTRLRTALLEGARDAAERVTCLAQGPRARQERKIQREARTLASRVERMRSAGL
jgi:gas vesicle protein